MTDTETVLPDRPLTHINKKGRPVSQCAHCRGLRKSRTTHTKCECGDKKKNSHKHDSDPHAVDKRDLKREHVGDGTPVHCFLICISQRILVQDVAALMGYVAPARSKKNPTSILSRRPVFLRHPMRLCRSRPKSPS